MLILWLTCKKADVSSGAYGDMHFNLVTMDRVHVVPPHVLQGRSTEAAVPFN